MKTYAVLAVAVLVAAPAAAQRSRGPVPPPREIRHDVALERDVQQRAHRIAAVLAPRIRQDLDAASRALVRRMADAGDTVNALTFARNAARRSARRLTPGQTDVLSFYVMAEAARQIGTMAAGRTGNMRGGRGRFDEMGSLSDEMSLRLQMQMDRRSKFIETLSNMMKKDSTTEDILVQNIK